MANKYINYLNDVAARIKDTHSPESVVCRQAAKEIERLEAELAALRVGKVESVIEALDCGIDALVYSMAHMSQKNTEYPFCDDARNKMFKAKAMLQAQPESEASDATE